MIKITDIHWVAGILEGEGSFNITNFGTSPGIRLGMTDGDIVQRVVDLINPKTRIHVNIDNRKLSYKDVHIAQFHGHHAVGWMMTIYPLMSRRRQQKIRENLALWKENSLKQGTLSTRHQEHRRIYKNLARKHGISWAEVKWKLLRGEIPAEEFAKRK